MTTGSSESIAPVGGTPALTGDRPVRLVHLAGSLAGTVQEVGPDAPVAVGRHPDGAVRYDHAVDYLVSSRHARLAVEDGRWTLTDTTSTNGTWVDGRRAPRLVLVPGQVVVLGTPGADGSAAFRVELAGGMPTAPAEAGVARPWAGRPPASRAADGPFAQEPPVDDGPVSRVASVGPGRVPGAAGNGTVSAGRPATSPPSAYVSAHPPVVVPVDGAFFGGIIGNVKGSIHRMRDHQGLAREVADLEQQAAALETAARTACAALGRELWARAAGAGPDGVIGLGPAAGRLGEAEALRASVAARRRAAEEEVIGSAAAHRRHADAWQPRHADLEADLALSARAVADARATLQQARNAAAAAVAARANLLAALARQAGDLAAEARQEPTADLPARIQAFAAGLADPLAPLREPVPGWADLLAARSAAADAAAAAAARHEAATAAVRASAADRTRADADRAAARRDLDARLAALAAEADQIERAADPVFADLGRRAVSGQVPGLTGPQPAHWMAAATAVGQANQAAVALADARRRFGGG